MPPQKTRRERGGRRLLLAHFTGRIFGQDCRSCRRRRCLIQSAALQRGKEAPGFIFGVGRQQFVALAQVAGDAGLLFGYTPAKQNPLERVQTLEGPRFQVARQISPEQPFIHKLLLLLLRQEWFDHLVKERRILPEEEQIEFVAGIFGLELLLFRVRQLRPFHDKGELA